MLQSSRNSTVKNKPKTTFSLTNNALQKLHLSPPVSLAYFGAFWPNFVQVSKGNIKARDFIKSKRLMIYR